MSKIYVFGIGGTGSRVLRSLTMLLAAGVECKANAIVPIIIDPDSASGDVERTAELMKKYGEIRAKLNFDTNKENRFFKTDIQQVLTNFRLPLSNTQDVLFDDYMGVSEMNLANQALVNMLFSQKNLASDMTVGFKGNPNVGSVVLNQFEESEQFQNFANEFTDKDKIFIISSIFGGTGASGFPLILKTLRTNDTIANKNVVNNAHIGAVTLLPYFQVKQDESSQVDSATFVSKAKSALAYYERNISKNNEIDNLYYLADDTRTTYENIEGGVNQKNDAHFLEMMAALSVLDFANGDKPATTIHKEFGIQVDSNEIIFENLGSSLRDYIRRALTQFVLFSKYLNNYAVSDYLVQKWSKDRSMDKTFFDGDFFKNLKNLNAQFQQWMDEMSRQQRAFTPFYLQTDPEKLFDLIKGIKQKTLYSTIDRNFKLFDNRLNQQSGQSKTGNIEQQFVELFYLATKQLTKEKFNIE